MKKKILALALAVCLVSLAVTGLTLAYFTDTDKATNTMTAGSVAIDQKETDRDGDDFVQNQKLIPAVYYEKEVESGAWTPYNGDAPLQDGEYSDEASTQEYFIWDKSVRNVVDKFVTVENTGSEDAYVRTIFLIQEKVITVLDNDITIGDGDDFWDILEENSHKEYLGDSVKYYWNDTEVEGYSYSYYGLTEAERTVVTIKNQEYRVVVATYDAALEAGEMTSPSLMQFYLDPQTTQDWYTDMGSETFEIRVLSQGVQAQGFDDAETALDLAFGSATDETNLAEWFELDD